MLPTTPAKTWLLRLAGMASREVVIVRGRSLGRRSLEPLTPASSVLRSSGGFVPVRVAFTMWFAAWVCGQLLAVVVLGIWGADERSAASIELTVIATIPLWVLYLVEMDWASRRFGSGHFAADYGLRFRAVDTAGLVVGALTQLVVVPAVYIPLQAIWPDTFSDDRVQESAKDLVDRASGGGVVVLVLLIALAAPVIEELVYRGLLQRSLATRTTALAAWLVTAALFTLVHLRPVEYPGLAVFSLVVGAAALVTDRLGTAITVHIGFNVTGLLVAWT